MVTKEQLKSWLTSSNLDVIKGTVNAIIKQNIENKAQIAISEIPKMFPNRGDLYTSVVRLFFRQVNKQTDGGEALVRLFPQFHQYPRENLELAFQELVCSKLVIENKIIEDFLLKNFEFYWKVISRVDEYDNAGSFCQYNRTNTLDCLETANISNALANKLREKRALLEEPYYKNVIYVSFCLTSTTDLETYITHCPTYWSAEKFLDLIEYYTDNLQNRDMYLFNELARNSQLALPEYIPRLHKLIKKIVEKNMSFAGQSRYLMFDHSVHNIFAVELLKVIAVQYYDRSSFVKDVYGFMDKGLHINYEELYQILINFVNGKFTKDEIKYVMPMIDILENKGLVNQARELFNLIKHDLSGKEGINTQILNDICKIDPTLIDKDYLKKAKEHENILFVRKFIKLCINGKPYAEDWEKLTDDLIPLLEQELSENSVKTVDKLLVRNLLSNHNIKFMLPGEQEILDTLRSME